MHWNLWLGFVAAAFVIGVIPGPAVTSIVGYALGSGRRTALASVAGMAVGSVIAMTLSLAGVGAILRASSTAFMILKWTGAAYLIGLGVVTLVRSRGKPQAETAPPAAIRPRTAFLSNMLLGSFHPKTIVFFVAALPQFVDRSAGHVTVQLLILGSVFPLIALVSDSAWAVAAGTARSWFVRSPRRMAAVGGAGGLAMIGIGATFAASGRRE
jgi:threonine/homoserine/homoserine lactone efflux protein